jgi:hypothetical protein
MRRGAHLRLNRLLKERREGIRHTRPLPRPERSDYRIVWSKRATATPIADLTALRALASAFPTHPYMSDWGEMRNPFAPYYGIVTGSL